mmetsp:Transcript_2469/g.3952  ORF Transcript_2469/g.3952 Transcript_2469/m.3952 type:complete len:192 (-) Transcript_2469:131-706(-)
MMKGIRLIIIASLAAEVISGRAPNEDKAASYPTGWCDLKFGTPTKTTGECMCRYRCEGSRCESAQGFIWYSYERCPHCKCVEPLPHSEKDTIVDIDDNEEEDEPLESMIPDFEEDDRTLGQKIFDFIDEQGHIIVALFFVLLIIVVLFPLLIFQIMTTSARLKNEDSKQQNASGTKTANTEAAEAEDIKKD